MMFALILSKADPTLKPAVSPDDAFRLPQSVLWDITTRVSQMTTLKA